MDDNLIRVTVVHEDDSRHDIEVPTDVSLSLMEVLKGSDYPILATCGGMALCATCHVEVLEKSEVLDEPQDEELAMLDTLPNWTDTSRLSCQIRISDAVDGLVVRVWGDGES